MKKHDYTAEALIDAQQCGATHFDTFWGYYLRNVNGVLQYFETDLGSGAHWALSGNKAGVKHLENTAEVICIETELAK